jgi:hypothetical protein
MANNDSAACQNLDISFLTITTNKTKEDVILILQKHEYKLQRIPLNAPVVTVEQASKDFKRERVLFNDVPFIPDTLDVNRSHTFALTLRRYVDILLNKERGNDIIKSSSPTIQSSSSSSSSSTTFNITSNDVADIIMQKACRTSAGSDSFFMVQKLFCVSGTFVTQRTSSHDLPIKVDLFLSNIKNFKSNSSINNNSNINNEISNSSVITTNFSENTSDYDNEKNINNTTISIVVDKHLQNESNIKYLAEGNESFQLCLCARTEVRNSFVVYDIDAMDHITGS